MRSFLSLFAGLIVIAAASHARADGLIYHLPPDGTGVRYETETTFKNADGTERMTKGSLSISSVGKATVEGEDCRWIEFKSITQTDAGERIGVTKLLIPEKHLGKGKSAGEHLIRGWSKFGDGEPQEIKDLGGTGGRGRFLIAGYVAGPPQNPGELAKAEIDNLKLGKVTCAGVTGEHQFQRDNGSLTLKFENRLHEKAPFGVVSAVWNFERQNNGQIQGTGTTRLTLADINPTALSDLPDRN